MACVLPGQRRHRSGARGESEESGERAGASAGSFQRLRFALWRSESTSADQPSRYAYPEFNNPRF